MPESWSRAAPSAPRLCCRCIRCAYGNAGNQASFGAGEAVKLAREALDPSRVVFKADLPAVADWPQGFGKLLLNAILTTVEWLPRGGLCRSRPPNPMSKAMFGLTAEGQQAGILRKWPDS